MNRVFQVLLIVSAVAFSWLGMMAVHELGHVLHLMLTGGTVDYVVLHPLAISYTHPGTNPHPLVVAWGGAIWGCAVPLGALCLVRILAQPWAYLAAFFAGFCLIANGAYLVGDAFLQGGDGRELVGHGSPPWVLVVLGLAAIAGGLSLWNGLGPHFGLGPARGKVDRRAAVGTAVALLAVILAEIALAGILSPVGQ
jgi:hypothetical protein